ncbi:MAG: hypothetical protein WC617_12355 [Rhodanobacter sp.]|jgi:hypothetical protein
MSTPQNTPLHQEVFLLLAARGNPDLGQNPDEIPYGTLAADQLVQCSMDKAGEVTRKFCEDNGLGGGNWVGGDIWENGEHIGHVAYNGRFFPGEKGPLVRDGKFVFLAGPMNEPSNTRLASKPEDGTGVLLSVVETWTDDDWYHVLSLRPDLADRLRAVLNRVAPEDDAEPSAEPGTASGDRTHELGVVSALEAIKHQLTVGEASEGNPRDIAWCARTASAALDAFRAQTSTERAHEQAVHEALASDLREALPDDDRYTVGFRDATESLTLALREHVAPDVLRESVQTVLDAYGNNAPEPEAEQHAQGL